MAAAEVATVLENCGFFAGVTGAGRKRLEGMAQVRRYGRGEMIFRQGQECPGVFAVGEGLVRIYQISPAGKEHVLQLAGPGGTFADVAAIGGFPTPAFAEALEEAVCVLLPAEKFKAALREDHQLCLELMVSMTMRVRYMVGQLEDIALRDAMGRVARYLLAQAGEEEGVRLPSLKRHLASHLNLTSETLSRTLRKLSEAGLIEEEDGEVRVMDRAGLSETAEGA